MIPGDDRGEEYGDAYPAEVQWGRPRRVTAAAQRPRIVLLPGDGIGPEIVAAARRVLEEIGEFEFAQQVVGGASIDLHGTALTEEVLEACRRSDADRKSTRLNSSHLVISYAVFCLKKKKT